MANKGLKSYTKQISGSIGSIGYNVNVNNNDSNLILTIPLLSSGGVNRVGLSLIYNHQNKNVTSIYGAGMKLNNQYKLTNNYPNYIVTNPDGSDDLYIQAEVIDGDTSHPTFIYKSQTSDFSLVKEAIYTSGIEKFYLKDKIGNKYLWNNGYNDISNIEYVNGFNVNYNPEDGVIINNGLQTRITRTLNSVGNINQLFCYEGDLEQSRLTFSIRTIDNYLSNLIYSYAGTVIEAYRCEFENNYIRIKDTKKQYAVVFYLANDKVTSIYEEYYGYIEDVDDSLIEELLESRMLYQITSTTGESSITNTIGDILTIDFNENDMPTLEYDDKGNTRLVEYNLDNKITFKSNVINPSKLALYGQRLTTPLSSTDLIASTTQSTGFLASLGFNQVREISNNDEVIEGREKYEATFEGKAHEAVTLVAFVKQKTACEESYGGYIQAVLYNDDTVVSSKEYHINKDSIDTKSKMVVLGLVPKANYNKIVVNVVALNVTFEYTDLIVSKYNFGTYYFYDNKNNITKIITGTNEKVLGYSDNIIESEMTKGNSEVTYKYDDKKNPLKTVNCYGVKTSYEYDSDTNELVKKTISSKRNGSIEYNYAYNNGDLTLESDSIGNTVNYSYDNYHKEESNMTSDFLLTSFEYTNNDLTKLRVLKYPFLNLADIDYTYDDKKNIKTITCKNGSVYDFTYDVRNRLTKVTINNKTLVELSYDNNDNIITKKYGNNNYFNFEYVENLLSAIKYGTSNRYSITYDPYERIKTITNILTNITTMYDYDSYDRISKITEGNSTIEYKYNESDNDIRVLRSIEGFDIIENHNNLTTTSISSANKLRGLFNENKRYVGSMCLNDSYLRGNYNGETYIYPTSFNNDYVEILTEGCVPVLNAMESDTRSFIVKSPSDTLSGGFGYWIKESSSSVYSLILGYKSDKDDNNALFLVLEERSLLLVLKQNGREKMIGRISSENYNDASFNFIFMSWKAYDEGGKHKLKYYIRLNETYCEAIIETSTLLELDNDYYFVGKVLDDATNYLYDYITGLIMSIDGMLTNEEVLKYYKLTKMYLINDPQRDLRDKSVDYQVSSVYPEVSGYDIYPLHGDLSSLSGKSPIKTNIKNNHIFDKGRCFNYNIINKRYCFEASGNTIEYKFGNILNGTISMMVYPYDNDNNNVQYLFEGSDSANNRIAVFIDSDNKVNIKIGNIIQTTTLSIIKNSWNFIGLSYSYQYATTTEVRLVVNSSIYNKILDIGTNLSIMTTVIGSNKDNSLPLYGQIEMITTSNSSKTISQLLSLNSSLKVITKTNEIDDLGRLKKSGIYSNGNNIIFNYIDYVGETEDEKYITTKVSTETIKTTSTETTLATRSYGYLTINNKNNITEITDSVFGNKIYSYNDRGFLTNDNGTNITYDSNGNIKKYGTNSFTYDSIIKDRLNSYNNQAINYSSSNPLLPLSYGNKTFSYEGNRLVSITESIDNDYTIYHRYYYNHEGLRIKKVIEYEFNDDRDSYSTTTNYFYNGDRLITEYRSDNDRIDFLYDNNGLLYGFINNKTERYYYVRDILQNILGIVDSNGNLIVKYDCNAYGDNQTITGNTTIGYRNPFRYKEYYYDSETGLFMMGQRYYSPELCRFIQPADVSSLNPSSINRLNLYSYANNNPIGIAYSSSSVGGSFSGGIVSSITLSGVTNGNYLGGSNSSDGSGFLGNLISGVSTMHGVVDSISSYLAGSVDGLISYIGIPKLKGFQGKLNKYSNWLMGIGIGLDIASSAYNNYMNPNLTTSQKWASFGADVGYIAAKSGLSYLAGTLVTKGSVALGSAVACSLVGASIGGLTIGFGGAILIGGGVVVLGIVAGTILIAVLSDALDNWWKKKKEEWFN